MGRFRRLDTPIVKRVTNNEMVRGKAVGLKAYLNENSRFELKLQCTNNLESALEVEYTKSAFVINGEQKFAAEKGTSEEHEVYVRVEPHDKIFKIFVNGAFLTSTDHRQPLENIASISVTGEVNLERLIFEDRYYMVPFNHTLDEYGAGRMLYIGGRIEELEDQVDVFEICMVTDDDIAFYFSPRFSEQRLRVVRNTQRGGKWDTDEESNGGFPFTYGRPFDIIIDCKRRHFIVYVDGVQFCTFEHRIPPTRINALHISGDVELRSIHY